MVKDCRYTWLPWLNEYRVRRRWKERRIDVYRKVVTRYHMHYSPKGHWIIKRVKMNFIFDCVFFHHHHRRHHRRFVRLRTDQPEYISIAVKSVCSHVGIQLHAARVFDCVLSKVLIWLDCRQYTEKKNSSNNNYFMNCIRFHHFSFSQNERMNKKTFDVLCLSSTTAVTAATISATAAAEAEKSEILVWSVNIALYFMLSFDYRITMHCPLLHTLP